MFCCVSLLNDDLNVALGRLCNHDRKLKPGSQTMMITLACAIGALVLLGYCAVVLRYLRRLPDAQD
jgi:hypothetical protein